MACARLAFVASGRRRQKRLLHDRDGVPGHLDGGSSAGTATSYNGTGATHGASRFDYVFSSKLATLALQSVNVPDTRIDGVYPSDHDPVVAVFIVK